MSSNRGDSPERAPARERLMRWLQLLRLLFSVVLLAVSVWRALGPA
jgi:hypothetical protein